MQVDSSLTEVSLLGVFPILLTIIIAVVRKEVTVALFLGVVLGSILFYNTTGTYYGLGEVFTKYILNAFADKGHAAVILFSVLISASIHILIKAKSFDDLIIWLSRFAKSKRSAQLITYFLGFLVFFDDYANTLIVGNTMQKVTAKYGVSKQKLAFIVDATAAPIAGIALVSTWIGYEVQLIDEGLALINYTAATGYGVFLSAVKYSFYPVLMLIFVFAIIWIQRDFGPMRKYEVNAEGELQRHKPDDCIEKNTGSPLIVLSFVFFLVFFTFFGIYISGERGLGFADAIQNGDCYEGLILGSSVGLIFSALAALNKRVKHENIFTAFYEGFTKLMPAIVVLVLAWSLNAVLVDLKLSAFLTHALTAYSFPQFLLPAVVFVLSALIAFSTGSSFSTMGILIPLTVTLFSFTFTSEGIGELGLLGIASVLSGAILGDHCSPISDTTILSSMATNCDHMSHVNTQLSYSLFIGSFALLLIVFQSANILPLWQSYLLFVGIIALVFKLILVRQRKVFNVN